MKILLYNCSIITNNGLYRRESITLDDAHELINKYGFTSYIGHKGTADILSNLFNINVEVNRFQSFQQVGEIAVIFGLNIRAPEGVIYTKEEVEQIGYSLYKLTRLE